MNVAEVARIWQQAGVSLIPIPGNKTKKPDRAWKAYQAVAPTLGEVEDWWANGRALDYGLALICGKVSGSLEMTELEVEATDGFSLNAVYDACLGFGVDDVWARLTGPEGFSEMSPSGGIHLLYRISDHDVPGNTKLARRMATEAELAARPDDKIKVRAETRGEGGYVIVAPSPGSCHPSGESWDKLQGEYGKLPTVTWDERCRLHAAITEALDEMPANLPATVPPPALPSIPPDVGSSAGGLSPGDDFEANVDWADSLLLGGLGWQLESRHGITRHWTRAGKDRREGASATTGRDPGRDRLYVFSTSTIFDSEVPYTKFGAYTLIHHGGDHSAAAGALARMGFGERRDTQILDDYVPETLIRTTQTECKPDWLAGTLDDFGNGQRLREKAGDRFRYVHQEKKFRAWDGTVWKLDNSGMLTEEWRQLTEEMGRQAQAADSSAMRKWTTTSRNMARVNGAKAAFKDLPGVTCGSEDFDPGRGLLNVGNGILDLRTGQLRPHDREALQTRMFGASYDPAARCPEFEDFITKALPDISMRLYVQRALGYSLLGDADQRSIFFIHGPSGTGKSTLMDTMREVFGDYGRTAASGAFKPHKDGSGPTNDLHGLRGRRFVTTSETSEAAAFDEDLLKRLSGRDQVVSRELYQDNVEWTPECALWLATNHPPKFNSDDDAVWRRLKLIPFTTVFLGPDEVRDMARSRLAPERDGILNWLLAGLADYLANGLGEPAEVGELAAEQRLQSDSAARFLDERIQDGVLETAPELKIRSPELYAMYQEWAKLTSERPVASRRFHNRIGSNFPALSYVKSGGYHYWVGLGRVSGASILGTFLPSVDD